MNRHASRSGLTMIELLLVLALIGLLAATLIPKVTSVFRVSVHSSVRRFASLVKATYDQAVLTGKVHRIVLDLDAQKWDVEMAEPGQLPVDPKRVGLLAEGFREQDRVTTEPAFKPLENIAAELPRGVRMVSVESQRLGKGVQEQSGQISIYAFPNGLLDQATVTFAEVGNETIQSFRASVNPLTGRVKVETVNQP